MLVTELHGSVQTKEIWTNYVFRNCDNVSSPRKKTTAQHHSGLSPWKQRLQEMGGWLKTFVELVKWED